MYKIRVHQHICYNRRKQCKKGQIEIIIKLTLILQSILAYINNLTFNTEIISCLLISLINKLLLDCFKHIFLQSLIVGNYIITFYLSLRNTLCAIDKNVLKIIHHFHITT